MGKKQSKPGARERAVVLAAAALLSAPIGVWLAWPRSPQLDDPAAGHTAVCPSVPGQPMVVMTYDSRYHRPKRGPSYTVFWDRFVAYDPTDGRVLHREPLGSRKDDKKPPRCLAASGDHVWMWTDGAGYHVREARTGAVVRSQQDLLGELARSLASVTFDQAGKRLIVTTKDGRTHTIDGSFRRSTVAKVPRGARRPVSPVLGNLDNTKTSRGALDEEGNQRRQILLDGEPLAGTDWLQPSYLVHPGSQSPEWPDPPSLIVCEPPELGEPSQILTRLALDGRILWTYRRAPEKSSFKGCRWFATADGTRLFTFVSPNGLVAIDPATGREAFRRAL